MIYRVPVFYQMFAWMEVEAESKEDAEELVQGMGLPEDPSYVDGSFEIDQEMWRDSLEGMDQETEDNEDEQPVFMVGTFVLAPDPVAGSDDAWSHEFEGTIVRLWTDVERGETPMATVRDQDDDCFDVELHRLTPA